MAKPNKALEKEIMAILEKNLKSIWEGDVAAYSNTTSEDCTFFVKILIFLSSYAAFLTALLKI